MNWQNNPYAQMSLAAAAVSTALMFFIWRRRREPGAFPFMLLMLAVTTWSLGYALELGSSELTEQLRWARIEYLGIVTVPTAWLVFALQYAGLGKRLTRRNMILLTILPLITLIIVWTNDLHHLLYRHAGQVSAGSFLVLDLTYGPWFWCNIAYSYLLLLVSLILIIKAFLRSPRLYRGQAGAMLVGALAPWAGNAFYISGLSPFPHLDLTPFAFTLSGLAMAGGLFRFRLLDIMPVARDAIFESIGDGTIVLDPRNRIVDLNPAAERIVGRTASIAIGQPVGTALAHWPDLIEYLDITTQGQMEIIRGEPQRTYDLRVSSLPDGRPNSAGDSEPAPSGRLIVLRDITEAMRARDALRDRNRELATMYEAATLISADLSLDAVLKNVAEQLTSALGASGCTLSLWSRDRNLVETMVSYCRTRPDHEEQLGTTYDLGTHPAKRRVLLTGQPESIQYDDPKADKVELALMKEREALTLLMLPLVTRDQVLGLVEMVDAARPRVFAMEEIRVAESLAAHASIAIENARLYEAAQQEIAERAKTETELRARERFLALLNLITQAGLTMQDLRDMAQLFADRLAELISADGCCLVVRNEETEGIVLLAASGTVRETISPLLLGSGRQKVVETVLRTGQTLAVDDVRDTQYSSQDTAEPATGRSLLGLPLTSVGQTMGVALLVFDEPHGFTHDEIRHCENAAGQIALAMSKARLLEGLATTVNNRTAELAQTNEALRSGIAERRLAEEALRASEEKYRALFEQSRNALFVTYLSGSFAALNQAGVELFGYSEQEPTRARLNELFTDPADASSFQQEIAERGFVRDFDAQLNKKDGSVMDCQITASVQRADDGKVVGLQGVIRDLTERKHLEEQMRQQDQMAALGQLAGGVAHDFNNVLMSIMLYAEMLVDETSLPPDLAPDVKSILDEAREASHLVRQVLDFSRRSPMETRPVDMRALIGDGVEILRRTLPKSVQVSLDMAPDDCATTADPTRLSQVFMNLVTNARDAMAPIGGGELRIRLSRLQLTPGKTPPVMDMAPGQWLCLSVSDTGPGIPPEVMTHIFEPFFTTRTEGTGLGLAQVHGIVGLHGGHIQVETEIGQGTTFRIYLPAQDLPEVEETLPHDTAEPIARGRGETVLVAEDEERVRHLCQRILESLGYRVLTAMNGREALDIYRSVQGIDLVLSDMIMPEMGGKELIQELRKLNPDLRAVAMTGYVLVEDLRQLTEEGALDVLHKPLDTSTLARAIRHSLDR